MEFAKNALKILTLALIILPKSCSLHTVESNVVDDLGLEQNEIENDGGEQFEIILCS